MEKREEMERAVNLIPISELKEIKGGNYWPFGNLFDLIQNSMNGEDLPFFIVNPPNKY